jgi:Predicted acyltransferases
MKRLFLPWVRQNDLASRSYIDSPVAVTAESPKAEADLIPREGGSHIPSLDGVRAVSIALVFLSHAGVSNLIPGGFGVTVFFFLSGFLITTLLTREQDRYGGISLKAFYLRRLVRLSPPILITMFAATALVVAGLAEGGLSLPTYLSQIFFFYNYHSLTPGAASSVEGLGILWSLSVEEHFYFIWPVVFIAIARGWIGIIGVLVMLTAILAWRYIRMTMMGEGEWTIYISTDTRIDSLLFGCLLALLIWRGHAARLFPEGRLARLALIAGGLAVLIISFIVRDEVFRSTLRYTVQGIALMPLFYYAVQRPRDLLFRPLNWTPLQMIGVWSYTIYLCHFVIILSLVYSGVGELGNPVLVGLSAALSCGFAALVWRYIERPLKPLRSRLTGR